MLNAVTEEITETMKNYRDYWEDRENLREEEPNLSLTNRYYISTDIGKIYYKDIPEDVHMTTEDVGEYTGTPVGACWMKYDGKLCKLYNTENNLQVIKIEYE